MNIDETLSGEGSPSGPYPRRSTIADNTTCGGEVGIAAFDFSAAFDTISCDTLMGKLPWMSPTSRALLESYMRGGVQRVIWNGALSSPREVLFGVRQGSVMGPLLFVLLTADLPCATGGSPDGPLNVYSYADDTSSVIAASDWDTVNKAMDQASASLENYSRANGLCLNSEKTQKLLLGNSGTPATCLSLLGITLNKNGGFASHLRDLSSDLRRRVGAIRQLAVSTSRGPLLNAAAGAIVVGKLQPCAWVTRQVRVQPGDAPGCDDAGAQTVLNDLARVLLGAKRSDRIRATDLVDRAGLPTVNQIVAKQAAIAAWKAVNLKSFPLSYALVMYDGRTRGSSNDLRRPISTRSIAANNMAVMWNLSPSLRSAKTLAQARSAAETMAKSLRHL